MIYYKIKINDCYFNIEELDSKKYIYRKIKD